MTTRDRAGPKLDAKSKHFPTGYADKVGMAMTIIRALAHSAIDAQCNCEFKKLKRHKSLAELLDDPNLTIDYNSHDKIRKEKIDGHIVTGKEYADAELGGARIVLRPLANKELGPWGLASTIAHELAHIDGESNEDVANHLSSICIGRRSWEWEGY